MAQTNEIMRLICPTHGSQRVPASNFQCPHGDSDQRATVPKSPSPTFLYRTSVAVTMPTSDATKIAALQGTVTTIASSVADHESRIDILETP